MSIEERVEKNHRATHAGRAQGIWGEEFWEAFRSTKIFETKFICTRDRNHIMGFYVHVTPDSISKVGQFPSLADLQSNHLKKYRKVLCDDKWRELSKSVGLHAHGVGVGAFVYLRRVFEHVIEQARITASKAPEWENDQFKSEKMSEKIKLLKDDADH